MGKILTAKIAYMQEEIEGLFTCYDYLEGVVDGMNNSEHEIICSLVSGMEAIERIVNVFANKAMINDSLDCTLPQENSDESDKYAMSPQEFSVFIKNWMKRHRQDASLCIGQVERMFNAPIEIYKKSFIQEKQ